MRCPSYDFISVKHYPHVNPHAVYLNVKHAVGGLAVACIITIFEVRLHVLQSLWGKPILMSAVISDVACCHKQTQTMGGLAMYGQVIICRIRSFTSPNIMFGCY